jgi:deoxyribonuclease-4
MTTHDIAISVHAPYFINFANPDPAKIQNSNNYVLRSVQMAQLMGARRVIMHSGVQDKTITREQSIARVTDNIARMIEYVDAHTDGDYIICPETMGKYSQIGSYQETIGLCLSDKRLIPCFDFGHINCVLQGALCTVDDYKRILDYGIDKLGIERMRVMHVHFSKIMYSKAGEVKHLTFEDTVYGPDYQPFIQAIVDYKLTPMIICESDGTMADDARAMQLEYQRLVRKC